MNDEVRTQVKLSSRAQNDLDDIWSYSVEAWGELVAERYIDSLEAKLESIRNDAAVLKHWPEMPAFMQYARSNKHIIFCDVAGNSIVVLAILHASRDLLAIVSSLYPEMQGEVIRLHNRVNP